MNEVCEIVPSQKGNYKINARGYLMVKEKNRDDLYYWCCEKRKSENCKGRVTTKFLNEKHYIQKFIDHNHPPDASAAAIAKIIGHIKIQAKNTRDLPRQIIQNNIVGIPQDILSYVPSNDALRQKIQRVRREDSSEPQSLEEINIPTALRVTLNGEPFLVKVSTYEEDKILLFTTKSNIECLSHTFYWIIDGTFKTVPTLFHQLYAIYAPVGCKNHTVLPLVYALMTSKSEEMYRQLFQDLIEFAEENDVKLKPSIILTDLELAVINASKSEFSDISNKICFFHLGQRGWRKIQSSGLATRYGKDEQFSLMLRHLFALAFIPHDEIPFAFEILKPHMPPEADEVVQWFENNYVHGRIKRRFKNGIEILTEPLFPPILWSVYDSIELGIPCIQYIDAWHKRWENLIKRTHIGLYEIIEEFQKEQLQVDYQIECILHGEPSAKLKKTEIDREMRITSMMKDRENRSVLDYLRDIALSISL